MAQVPAATIAVALGASRSSHSLRRHRLPGRGIVAEPAPVALILDLLVGDRPFDDEHERFQFAAVGFEEPFEEVVLHLRSARTRNRSGANARRSWEGRERAERDLLDAGLGGGSQRHGITVTTQSGVDPKNVDQRFFCFYCCLVGMMSQLSWAGLATPRRGNADAAPPLLAYLR